MSQNPISRRTFLQGTLALTAASSSRASAAAKPRIVVVGAGAFGGWSAYSLLRRGADVTLLDAWGAGNSRSSSGGETRILRSVYGSELFTDLALRAFELWQEAEQRWQCQLFQRTGYLAIGLDEIVEASLRMARKKNLPLRDLDLAEARKRYPQIHFDDGERVFYEPTTGYLLARESCRTVAEHFVAEGGEHRTLAAEPGPLKNGRLEHLVLSDGSHLTADAYVFACGSWLAKLFPGVLAERLLPTRQEVFYFGTPAGDERFAETRLPVWTDRKSGGFYGIPGNRSRGFKIANHHRGKPFDPSTDDRLPQAEKVAAARSFVAGRFPALAEAPLIEARVCHYGNSPDGSFLVDRHPEASNLWLVGGGSGHGFKHGPALGEKIAGWVLDDDAPEPAFSLSRFNDA
jgi:glycine/D-amino acid oxidase-like deaminating enzyme